MKAILITSSILILALAALRPVLRGRFKPQVQYALWLIAAVRLLVPFESAPSAFSALALLDKAERPAQVAQAIGQTHIPTQSYGSAWDQALREYEQSNGPITTDGGYEGLQAYEQVEYRAQALMRGPTLAQLFDQYARPVWLGGAALMAVWFLLVNLRLRRRLRTALPVEADCPLPVYVSDALPSPCLCGTFRPRIYVTPAALADPDRLRHVLAHELTHYRHRDHWWALVRCACLSLYWFDPLVWWAAALSRQDCELACDAGAIRRLGEGERLSYGRTLIAMIAAGRTSLLQTATTMTGGKRRVKERVELIARRPKTAAALTLAVVLLVGCAVGCTFTGAPEGSQEPVTSPDPAPLSSQALNTATLPARLLDVPEELRDHVEAASENGTLAVYYFKKPSDALGGEYPSLLAVRQLSQEQLDEAVSSSAQGHEPLPFAMSGGQYYVLNWSIAIEYAPEDKEQFNAAFESIKAFAEKTVLETEGVEPYAPPQQAVQAVIDRLLAAPAIQLSLAPAGTSRVYAYSFDPSEGFNSYNLSLFASRFRWEETGYSTSEGAASLRIEASDGSAYLYLSEGSYLVLANQGGESVCYKGVYSVEDYVVTPDATPFDYLRRMVFDPVELNYLRSTTVPDRGQSHEDIAQEWAENWEGAMAQTAPGSRYACTIVRIENVRVDQPEFESREALEEFVKDRNFAFTADDFGKIWFGFSYDTVFVPEDPDEETMWAGNTRYYEGSGAPEGALVYSHVGYIWLTDEGWTCTGVGTGW